MWLYSYAMLRTGRSIDTGNRMVSRDEGQGRRGVSANWYRISFRGDETVLELLVGQLHSSCE
jgi:hypothetical protein